MYQRIIFTGLSGLRTDEKTTSDFYSSFLPNSIPFFKLEDFIKTNYAKKNNNVSVKKIWLGKFLQQPPEIVQKEWKEALNVIKNEIDNRKIDNYILAMHAVFYNYRTNEYICPVSEQLLKLIKPQVIITLIDDIFDIHNRLKENGHIFCTSNGGSDIDDPNGLLYEIIRILDWRANEIMVTRHLAMELGIKHYLLAIKHDYKLLDNLIIKGKESAYVSHPITQVRNHQRDGNYKKAKKIISEIHRFEEEVSENFSAFLPTTIDEYRFKKDLRNNRTIILNELFDRWDAEKYSSKINSMFEKNKKENISLWRNGKSKGNLNQLLWILAKIIEKQINVRDHFLVEQCNALIVYRPCYDGIASDGVLEEIDYYLLLKEVNRKCLVYLPKVDRDEFLIKQFESVINNQLKEGKLKQKGRKRLKGIKLKPSQRRKMVEYFQNDSTIFTDEFLNEEKIQPNINEVPLKDKVPMAQKFIQDLDNSFLSAVNKVFEKYKKVATVFVEDEKSPKELMEIFINKINEGKND